jgi:hypothetical protein
MEKELLLQILANQYVLYKKLEEIQTTLPPLMKKDEHNAVNYKVKFERDAASIKNLIKQDQKSVVKKRD